VDPPQTEKFRNCGANAPFFLWLALRAATEKAAREGDQIAEKSILERIFISARTYFTAPEPKTPPLWQPTDNLWNTPRAERKRGKQAKKR